jgi:hypothetical protein
LAVPVFKRCPLSASHHWSNFHCTEFILLNTNSPLIAEFLKDHQQFSRLLLEVSKLLDSNNLEKARQRAEELNKLAGPHIAFEEAELYSRLIAMGERSISKAELVDQHHEIRDALRQLLENHAPDADTVESIKSGFRDGVIHAEHCGTLISLVSRLDEDEQAKSLESLLRFRQQGTPWTELE